LDSSGDHVSAHLSEVDLSDPEDVRATVPTNGADLRLHFGDEEFLARWHNYQAHISQWEQQYPHLASIDLRYDREVVLKMAGAPETNASAGTPAVAPADTKPAPVAKSPKPSTPVEHKGSTQHASKGHKPQPAKHPAGKDDKKHANRRTA
jgi:cell division protein FtsQ